MHPGGVGLRPTTVDLRWPGSEPRAPQKPTNGEKEAENVELRRKVDTISKSEKTRIEAAGTFVAARYADLYRPVVVVELAGGTVRPVRRRKDAEIPALAA